jgi:hypothetical protein
VNPELDPCCAGEREASSRFGFLSAEDFNEALGGEADDFASPAPASLIAPTAFPAWPRVYPGL